MIVHAPLGAVRAVCCAALVLFAIVLLAPCPARAEETAPIAGEAAAVEGEVFAVNLQEEKRALLQGGAVYVGETVQTGPEGKVQLKFLDDSIMDVGNDSEVVINSLVYDPKDSSASSQALSMLKGLFRFVSGAITGQDPENLHLQAPLATVGIRGTITDHYVDVSEEHIDGTPVRVINSELHALRESSARTEVVVTSSQSSVVLTAPDTVAEVTLDMPVTTRKLNSFDKRLFGNVAIEPYSFDPEVKKGLRSTSAQPIDF